MTNQYEFEGKTVDDAIADGLIQLGLRRDQVDIEVVDRGNRGLFGIGSEPALVRLVPHSLAMAQEVHDLSTASEVLSDAASGEEAGEEAETGNESPGDASTQEPMVNSQSEESQQISITSSANMDNTVDSSADIIEPQGAANAADNDPSHNFAAHDSRDEGTSVQNGVDTVAQSEQMDVGMQSATETPSSALDGKENDFYPEELNRAELTTIATELLNQMIALMGFTVSIDTEWQEPEEEDEAACLLLNVEGEELGPLIGRNGETLSNIQYLLRLMINQRIREWRNIVVDIAGYKARRTEKITQLALRMAQQVTSTGRAVALEPMPSNERRVIHMTLRDHPDVYTQSTGDTDRRKVNIFPRQN